MFEKSSMNFPPKVAAAMDVLYELRYGSKYDYIFDRSLQVVSLEDLKSLGRNRDPVVANILHADGRLAIYRNPKIVLQDFKLDHCNWFEEKDWNPEKSDCTKLDMRSNWYVTLWSGHKTWGRFGQKRGVISVGISQKGKDVVAVNSFGIEWYDGPIEDCYKTDCIILPRL